MMSKSLSLAASPFAREPKRMIRLGWAAWTSTPVTFETICLVAGLKANTTPTTSLPHVGAGRGGSRTQDCGEVRVGHVTDSPPSTTRPRAGQIRGYFGLLGTGPLYAGRPGRTYLLRTRIRHRRPGRSPRWRLSFRGRRIGRPKRVSQINLTSCCHV
jgi:hypothetical protein